MPPALLAMSHVLPGRPSRSPSWYGPMRTTRSWSSGNPSCLAPSFEPSPDGSRITQSDSVSEPLTRIAADLDGSRPVEHDR